MDYNDNTDKNIHGTCARTSLRTIISNCGGSRLSYIEGYFAGYAGFDPKQFYAAYLITFSDNDKWIVYSTTSLRDRIKCQQWDAMNLKQIDSTIKSAILVGYPEKEIEAEKFKKYGKKINNPEGQYSALDYVISANDFVAVFFIAKIRKERWMVNTLSEGQLNRIFSSPCEFLSVFFEVGMIHTYTTYTICFWTFCDQFCIVDLYANS